MELAINGGKPVRNEYLSYGKQWIDEEDINTVVDVLRGDFLTTGPYVRKFEKSIADYVGAKYAVALSNGTAALHAACFAAGIKDGDEVIVTPLSFAASANCVLYCGGKPVFVDIDDKTYNIDANKIEEAITPNTKAIIPVDFAGQAVDMDTILHIAEKHNITVIEDAAHALGSKYKGRMVGSASHMTEFSFHPVKPITTGEGGVVVTNNESLYKKLSMFRTHGITRDKELLTKDEGPWYYEQQDLGYNYRITDIQCALGLSQMNKIDMFIRRRQELVKKYNELLKDVNGVITPYEAQYSNSGWHIYVLRFDLQKFKCTRRQIFQALQAENIGVNVHYLPIYLHPYYKELGYKKGLCPNAEKVYDSIITLPLFPKMTDEDLNDVVCAVKKVAAYYEL